MTARLDNLGCILDEYCLYCGIKVSGKYRSPHDNAMCKKHYFKIYGNKL